MEFPWSLIPPEIAHEITSHNTDDVPTLRAMCLVSKTTRSLAMIHLFSSVHFSSMKDVDWWRDMVANTPALAKVVRTVKFSNPADDDEFEERHVAMGLTSVTELDESLDVLTIPPFPNVEVVEYNGYATMYIAIKGGQTTLFPRLQKLRLVDMCFYSFDSLTGLIGSCGRLKSLSFNMISFDTPFNPQPLDPKVSMAIPDLSALVELSVKDCDAIVGSADNVFRLFTAYPPSHLQTFALELFDNEEYETYPDAAQRVMQHSAPSLVNLVLDPRFPGTDHIEILEMFQRLPAFPALNSLTFWLSGSNWVEQVVNALKGAPNLTRLNFRLALYENLYDDVRDLLCSVLEEAFPWGTSESMKQVIMRKFPSCRKIVFQFCVADGSEVHFRRGARRRLEARLKNRLEETGADIGDYLHVEWLNTEFQPVVYRATNGKPAWGACWSQEWREPETEASDCESETGNTNDQALAE